MEDWYSQVRSVIAQAVALVFDMDPASDEAADFVRIPYQDTTTTPQLENSKNVCYVDISAAPEFSGRAFRNTVWQSDGKAKVERVLCLESQITFYGPDCDTFAERFRTAVMFDGGYGTPRAFLRQNRLVPLSMPDAPSSLPEVVDGYWRYRSDITLRLMYYMTQEFAFNQVTSTDIDIGVKTE